MNVLKLDDKALLALMEALGPEFKIELQNAVIQNFASKHLKGLVSDIESTPAFQKLKAEVHSMISDSLKTISTTIKEQFTKDVGLITKGTWGNIQVELHSRFKDQIAEEMNREYVASISGYLEKLKQEIIKNEKYYKDYTDKQIKLEIDKKAKELVNKAMENLKGV